MQRNKHSPSMALSRRDQIARANKLGWIMIGVVGAVLLGLGGFATYSRPVALDAVTGCRQDVAVPRRMMAIDRTDAFTGQTSALLRTLCASVMPRKPLPSLLTCASSASASRENNESHIPFSSMKMMDSWLSGRIGNPRPST